MVEERSRSVGVVLLLAFAWWLHGTTGTLQLGVTGVQVENDVITGITAGSPADRAGLEIGDRVDDVLGDEGTLGAGRDLTYTISRDGESRTISLQAAPWRGAQRDVMLATLAMGFVHLACAAVAWFATRGKAAALFTLFCATTAAHWSGFRPTDTDATAWAWFTVLLLGTGFSSSFLLHFTLAYPRAWTMEDRRGVRIALYAPPVLALIVAVASVALYESTAREPLQGAFYLLTNVPGYLYSLLALVVVTVRIRRSEGGERRAGLHLLLLGMLVAYVPYLVFSLVESVAPSVPIPGGLGAYPYTLFFVVTPVAFLYVMLTRRGAETI